MINMYQVSMLLVHVCGERMLYHILFQSPGEGSHSDLISIHQHPWSTASSLPSFGDLHVTNVSHTSVLRRGEDCQIIHVNVVEPSNSQYI